MSEADKIIADLELRGLGWSIERTKDHARVRILDWPTPEFPSVVAEFRTNKVLPLAAMLVEAAIQLNWKKHPVKGAR